MAERKRGRPKNDEPTKKVEPRLPPGIYDCLMWIAKKRRYGNNPTEVARHLIVRGIEDWEKAGFFKDMDANGD